MIRMRTLLAAALIGAAALHGLAQSYSSGQPVWPAFEGWEQNEDGSANFVFGYMNDNWQEELDVAVGPENSIEPGGPDCGQPTHFQPRRNRFVFRVRVPKDWGNKEMTWTLATHGVARQAFASLRTDLQIENIDIMSETGALGAGSSNPEIRGDKPPVIKIVGSRSMTATVGKPLTLTAIVTDDGVPRPRGGSARARGRGAEDVEFRPPSRITVGKNVGLHLSWFVYRGAAAAVTFEPRQIKTWEDTREGANSPWAPRWIAPPMPPDGKCVATVTFDQPGTYMLRARADDGALTTDEDVTVSVSR